MTLLPKHSPKHQEAVPLSAANVVLGGGSENAACWDSAIAQTLNGELERFQWQGRANTNGAELQESMASLALAPPADEGSEAGDTAERHHERFVSADGGDADSSTLALSPRSSRRFLSPALSSEGSEYLSGDETLDVSIDGDPSMFVQVGWSGIGSFPHRGSSRLIDVSMTNTRVHTGRSTAVGGRLSHHLGEKRIPQERLWYPDPKCCHRHDGVPWK